MTPKSKDVNKASWFQNPFWKGTASAVPMKPTKGAGFSPEGLGSCKYLGRTTNRKLRLGSKNVSSACQKPKARYFPLDPIFLIMASTSLRSLSLRLVE